MSHIYIALVDTPGFFASLIRRFLKQRYVHVVIAADAQLDEAYSVGRRIPALPLIAGFEKENKSQILHAFPSAYYCIGELDCTHAQKRAIMERLVEDYHNRLHIHYAVLALPFLVMGIPFYIRNQYTCSSYIAQVLQENGVAISDKHFSLVTPKDFYEYENMRLIYEGSLSDITGNSVDCNIGSVKLAMKM